MFKALQQLLGCKKDVAVEEKAEVKEMPKRAKRLSWMFFRGLSLMLLTVWL